MAIVPPCFGAVVATGVAALAVVAEALEADVAVAVDPVPPELAVVAVDVGSPLELFEVHAAKSVAPANPMTRNASRRCSRY